MLSLTCPKSERNEKIHTRPPAIIHAAALPHPHTPRKGKKQRLNFMCVQGCARWCASD